MAIACDPNSSDGLGGRLPAGRRSRAGRTAGLMASRGSSSPTSRSLSPGERSKSKPSCSIPRRRSASTSSVLSPRSASTAAKFAAFVDFPSPGPGLVKIKLLSGCSRAVEKAMLVRSTRKASAAKPSGSWATTSGNGGFPSPAILGIQPSTGTPRLASASEVDCTERSRYSRKNAAPTPSNRPRRPPKMMLMRRPPLTGRAHAAGSSTSTYGEISASAICDS